MRAVASFEFDSFDEDPPYRADGGAHHQRAHIEKTFRGEIEGHGSVEMLAARAAEGAGVYFGNDVRKWHGVPFIGSSMIFYVLRLYWIGIVPEP